MSTAIPELSKTGFDISGNYSLTKYIRTPLISLSYMRINEHSIHEVAGEYGSQTLGEQDGVEEFSGSLALSYSYLKRFKERVFYLGPYF